MVCEPQKCCGAQEVLPGTLVPPPLCIPQSSCGTPSISRDTMSPLWDSHCISDHQGLLPTHEETSASWVSLTEQREGLWVVSHLQSLWASRAPEQYLNDSPRPPHPPWETALQHQSEDSEKHYLCAYCVLSTVPPRAGALCQITHSEH